eukprot:974973_1
MSSCPCKQETDDRSCNVSSETLGLLPAKMLKPRRENLNEREKEYVACGIKEAAKQINAANANGITLVSACAYCLSGYHKKETDLPPRPLFNTWEYDHAVSLRERHIELIQEAVKDALIAAGYRIVYMIGAIHYFCFECRDFSAFTICWD